MKQYQLYIVIALLFCYTNVNAQQLYNNQINLQNVSCEQKGSQLHLSMNINASKADIPSRDVLVLTPIIKSGNKQSEFPPIVIAGKNRYKADKRAEYFDDKTAYKIPYVKVQTSSSALSSIGYDYTLPYEDWMSNAKVEMREEVYGCATCKNSENWNALTPIAFASTEPQKPTIKPVVSYVTPVAEAVKNRNMQGQAYLDFQVGKSIILTDFRNNFRELSKIQEAINNIKNDPNVVVNGITLKGFASPEGTYKTNERLSEDRSQALKNYLQKEYNYPNSMFNVSSVAEDWQGLKKLMETSDITDKQAILNIIDDNSDYDVKESKLKALKSYKEILDNYFPQLRRTDYKLDYTVRAFSVEEGKEIIKTNPGQMSLNEMFLVANTYAKGSEDFNRVFDIAVRLFPTDKVANINAAAIVLSKGETVSAHRFLDPYQDAPESWNNQGVMYMLEGNYTKAKDFLTKAQGSEASQNLKILEQLQDYKAKEDAYNAAKKQ